MIAGARAATGAVALAVISLALALATTGLGGCAHQGGAPGETLSEFGAAVERGDFAAAYALTSADFQRRVPLAAFRAGLEAGGDEGRALARRVHERASAAGRRVEVAVELGETVPMVYEAGGWRVDVGDGQLFNAWSQRTPRAALRSFVRALEQRRYDVALRLVPNRYRARLSVDMLRDYWEGERRNDNRDLLTRLRAAATANVPIVEVGDEAHMPYGDKSEARFIREDGVWRIEDPD